MIDYHMAMSVFFLISFILFTVCHAYIAKEYVLLIDIFKRYQIQTYFFIILLLVLHQLQKSGLARVSISFVGLKIRFCQCLIKSISLIKWVCRFSLVFVLRMINKSPWLITKIWLLFYMTFSVVVNFPYSIWFSMG